MRHLNDHRPLLSARIAQKVLLIICGATLCAIFIAGLSPFTPRPRNQVKWLENQNGLYFGEYASILSSAPLRWDEPLDGPCSIEFWMQPGVIKDSNTMLAFDLPGAPVHFTIRQSLDDLALAWKTTSQRHSKQAVLYIPHAFRKDTPSFITLTSGRAGVTVYLNGVLVRSSPEFRFTRQDLFGQMVIGNSPWADDSWSGDLHGLGMYARELTAEQVRQNYTDWTISGQPKAPAEEQAIAIFPFKEKRGVLVANQIPGGIDLFIPAHYLVLHPRFLEPFWRPTAWSWGFWKDVLVNVFGFMPLGFFFCVYFSRSMPVKRAILATIVFGCAVSFFIEAMQYFLPTRDSDSRDWLNNTLGTALGALVYGPGFVQAILARFGVVRRRTGHFNLPHGEAVLKES
jgi:VanZ like family/Concanavalin A-like lectin/glucanases superfamily